ncbi:NUDIX hydrolase [Streptomyces caniscabiei]|uniref:NUDIX hydrolase n=1 Tax=Streptomyces caniscabiei TaxID=2746961 RepID=UPI0029B848B3|nr:NUDIX hydrolase [Streptomyces caniscabiei]MDX2776006.1 NUDIX hydrolase [Streptomyces caniscabiei]
MRPTHLESDVFKFHLRALVDANLVVKNDDGSYSLTATGKEFANNVDDETGLRSQSPKVSMLLVVRRQIDGETKYLFQQRQRSPFYGYWGLISGPVAWGVAIETAAHDELVKQSGLSASFRVQGFCRVRDYTADSQTLLEDKLFAIVVASADKDELRPWQGGTSQWMTVDELAFQPKHFDLTEKVLSNIGTAPYFEVRTAYFQDSY